MTDFPIHSAPSVINAEGITAAVARLIRRFLTDCSAVAQATARNAQGRAKRRAPEDILAAHARREEARRAVDRLLR